MTTKKKYNILTQLNTKVFLSIRHLDSRNYSCLTQCRIASHKSKTQQVEYRRKIMWGKQRQQWSFRYSLRHLGDFSLVIRKAKSIESLIADYSNIQARHCIARKVCYWLGLNPWSTYWFCYAVISTLLLFNVCLLTVAPNSFVWTDISLLFSKKSQGDWYNIGYTIWIISK